MLPSRHAPSRQRGGETAKSRMGAQTGATRTGRHYRFQVMLAKVCGCVLVVAILSASKNRDIVEAIYQGFELVQPRVNLVHLSRLGEATAWLLSVFTACVGRGYSRTSTGAVAPRPAAACMRVYVSCWRCSAVLATKRAGSCCLPCTAKSVEARTGGRTCWIERPSGYVMVLTG